MGANSTVKVTFLGDASDLSKAARQAENASDGIGKKFGSLGKVAGLALGGAVVGGIAAVGAAMVRGVQDAASYQQITDQVAQTIQSTGKAAGVTVGDLKKYAAQLESISGVDEELILSGQNVLLTFTKVQNEVGKGNDIFNQASQAALNLSTTMGGDLVGANTLVGKALNDPIKGMTALSRAGVQLTADQKETIKAMVESGDTMGAQKIILGELETQFGGAAKAAGQGFTGSMARFKDSLSDAGREVGTALLPVLTKLADWLAVNIPIAMEKGKAAFAVIVAYVQNTLLPMWARNRDTVMTTLGQVGDIIKGFVDLGMALWDRFGKTVVAGLKGSFEAIATTVRGALTLIKGFVDIWTGIFTGDWRRVWDGIKGVFSGAFTVIQGLLGTFLNAIKTAFSLAADALKGVWQGMWKAVVGTATSAISGLLGVLGSLFSTLGKLPGPAGAPFRAAAEAAENAKAKVDAVTRAINAIPTHKSSTITVTTIQRTIREGQQATGKGLQAFAKGGVAMPGLALVGEEGPELVQMRGGERVYNAKDSRKMAAAGGGTTYQLVLSGDHSVSTEDVPSMFRRMELLAGS